MCVSLCVCVEHTHTCVCVCVEHTHTCAQRGMYQVAHTHTHMCTTLCTIHGGGKVYPKIEAPGLPGACITTTANSGGVVSAMTGSV